MLKKTNCYLNTDIHFATLDLTEGQTRSEKDKNRDKKTTPEQSYSTTSVDKKLSGILLKLDK